MLMEFLHGALTHRRLRDLGARVIAVNAMQRERPFSETFARLEAYRIPEDEAFSICERVYRGGGFAKDYLYLAGLLDLYRFRREGGDLRPLLAGKFPLEELPIIRQFMDGGLFLPATFLPPIFSENSRESWPFPSLPIPEDSLESWAQLPCAGLLEELVD